MGLAHYFGMGSIWVHIWDPRGTYLGLHGSHTGCHYGANSFANEFGMNPIWVQAWDVSGATLEREPWTVIHVKRANMFDPTV